MPDAPADCLEPCADLPETTVNVFETGVNMPDAPADCLEPCADLLEPNVNVFETGVNVF